MARKMYVLYEPGGNLVRGFAYGKLVEVRYIDIVRTGIESPDRDEFIRLVERQQLTDEELSECRIGYVDENGVGEYRGWQEFLDLKTESG
ncbi:MAG: hypothetical protein OXI40_15385 [Chloroflexota bacterium]|nr:hypothetical protein [Chloroflexota bacterium]